MARMSRRLPVAARVGFGLWPSGFCHVAKEHANAKVASPPPVHQRARNASAPVVLGSWVGFSDMRVKRQPLDKKQQPRGSESS